MCDIYDFFNTDDEEDGPKRGGQIFFPALSIQRYDRVLDELLRHEDVIDKLVDFGCNECKFLTRAKQRLQRTPLMFGVDLDENVLLKARETLAPHKNDYLYKLDFPLRMKLYAGSVGQYDRRLDGVDAVVAIELVEHLNYRALQNLPDVIFGKLQPFIVIITTPNFEYNIVFDMGDRKFRHEDHKFEWTRAEFENWCDKITVKYRDYWVKYTGVGEPPINRKDVGYCTQIAVFRMRRANYLKLRHAKREQRRIEREQFSDCGYSSESQALETDYNRCQPYKLIEDIKFPSKASEAREGRMLLELRCYCQNLIEIRNLAMENLDGKLGVWFALADLRQCGQLRRYLKTDDDLALFLVDQGWLVKLQDNMAFYDSDPDRSTSNNNDQSGDQEDDDYFWNQDNNVVLLSGSSDDDTGISTTSEEFSALSLSDDTTKTGEEIMYNLESDDAE